MYKSSAELRDAFLNFFRSKEHQIVASSSLVPADDPTLLFTNAGMNQFKDAFLGIETRSYTRATSSQRCVRAGGKHNDLENVGYTARHHTFFEMLGNFSFGDYFKQDAILYAWEFLTGSLQLPKDKLLITVYETDDEAFKIWVDQVGVSEDRVIRIGDKSPEKKFDSDNFWSMGDTGPCGPCTEIFYDHGEHIQGGPPGSPDEDGDRFIEIWNLVFMQYNRHADGSMEPLPKPSVDTGMGLERIAAILQSVHSNYEIDTFQSLIKHAAQIIGTKDLENKSLRVIADHIRSCAFLIADGVMPSNEGRGYVLRRIIRRAVRHGHKLGATDIFFYRLAPILAQEMGAAYDELNTQMPVIQKVLRVEEDQFARTLDRGMDILEESLESLKEEVIPGELIFKLYDTYGFPADLTADIAREKNLVIDELGFEKEMAAQRARAKQASNFGTDYNEQMKIEAETNFCGYDRLHDNVQVVGLYQNGEFTQQLKEGEEGMAVLDHTPFYAESGGQIGDRGRLSMDDGVFTINDVKKNGNAFVHYGYVERGEIHVGEELTAEVDRSLREAIALNHSATHLMHAALREVLGEHVTQKGSLVDAERLRFDFSHFEAIPMGALRKVEDIVNTQIRANNPVQTQLMDLQQAKRAGAMALFGEKYDEEVRVVSMGDYSTELCGGTHVERTGDIGFFKIISEAGIAAGIRRIEAVTGQGAIDFMHQIGEQLIAAAGLLKGDQHSITDRVKQMIDRSKMLEREVEQLKSKVASHQGSSLIDQAREINGVKVLVSKLEGIEAKALRGMVDDLKNKLGSGIVVLGVTGNDKVSLIAGVTKDLTAKVKAGDLINVVATLVGGRGGGRPDMAQAGGTDVSALPAALETVTPWLRERL